MTRYRMFIRMLGISFLLSGCFNDKRSAAPHIGGQSSNHTEDQEDGEDGTAKDVKKDGKDKKDLEKSGSGQLSESSPDGTSGPEGSDLKDCSVMAEKGKTYEGFGGVSLTAGRAEMEPQLANRYRIKPFEALSGDITRFLGSAPKSLAGAAASFPNAGARWFIEPIASGVTLFSTFRVGYEAGLLLANTETLMATAPTDASAQEVCSKYIKLAWLRDPGASEMEACKAVALVATASETDIKARWAYTIGSILTASDFVTY